MLGNLSQITQLVIWNKTFQNTLFFKSEEKNKYLHQLVLSICP